MEHNILCNIKHFPLIITKIFGYSLKRPFIIHSMIQQSEYLKEKLDKFKIDKYNTLSKQINKLYSFFEEISVFQKNYEKTMTQNINIEHEEKNFYLTKPYINSLSEISDKFFSFYKSLLGNNKDKYFFTKSLFEYCSSQPYILLSINLFSKDNDINNINMELTEADLDYSYIKFLNKNQNLEQRIKQNMRIVINIYNKYYKFKKKFFLKNVYYNNINLLKQLNIEEIYFIKSNEEFENIYLYKNQIIEEINTMFTLIQELKNKNKIINVNFSDSIIKNISLLYNEIELIKTFNNNNEFKNLKKIGISHNLLNNNIKKIIHNLFNYNSSVICYQDIINLNNTVQFFDNEDLYINLENRIIYDINLYKYLSNIFNIKNNLLSEKIKKIEIIYNCQDINLFFKSNFSLDEQFIKDKINKCYLPNLTEIIIKNNTNRVYRQITKKISTNKLFNFISFICSFSKSLSSIIINDSFIPFNVLDYNNMNITNITNLNIRSPSLNEYSYSEIIGIINKFKNIQYINIDTLSSEFNDSFNDVSISKNLENIKEFNFNDFFSYKNIEKNKIIFKQSCNIDKDLFCIFSEIVENEKQLENLELNGFLYNFGEIKNKNVKDIKINLEENDKKYEINKIKFKEINLKLQNFPNLNNLYIYVDILQTVDNLIQFPIINTNLKRIFLFSSYINCDINKFDNLLKQNGVELILRIIESYNKGMIMAYIASFPNNH